jgi:hypothetical protein
VHLQERTHLPRDWLCCGLTLSRSHPATCCQLPAS